MSTNGEDMAYLETLLDINRELRQIVLEHEARSVGIVGRANLVALWLEQNARLIEACTRHERVLKWFAGHEVPPMAHSAEGVLIGTLGGSLG